MKGQVTELFKKLNRAVGMLYKIKHFAHLMFSDPYITDYNSYIAYGLVVWGTKINQLLIKLKISKKVQFTLFQKGPKILVKYHFLFYLKILNIVDLFKLQLSSLIWEYDHDIISIYLIDLFKRSNIFHKHGTRGATLYQSKHYKIWN